MIVQLLVLAVPDLLLASGGQPLQMISRRNSRPRLTISSYELFVQEPIRLAEILSSQPFSCTNDANLDKGVARSGVKGPLIVGSMLDKSCWREMARQKKNKDECTHDLNQFIVLGTSIGTQEPFSSGFISGASDWTPSRRVEISLHTRRVREGGCRCAHFRPHVGDCRKAYVYVSAKTPERKGRLIPVHD